MACLSLSLMGTFQVSLDGEPATGFKSDKVRGLLAYLAVEAGRPHRREALASLLWPDWPDRSTLSNLRYNLSDLRQAIGDPQASPPFLQITHDTVQFNTASDHWLDVTAFLELTEQAKSTATDSAQTLEQAVALYQGDFLSGFSIKDSAPFDEWALLKREQLHRQMMSALYNLANLFEQRGAYELAQTYARRQVELEPWNEEAHQQLMRVLALGGHRSTALAQYANCRRSLVEELGVEPSHETTTLYDSIRDEKLRPPAVVSLSNEESPVPGKCPYKGLQYFDESDADLFFGREKVTAKLVTRLRQCLSPQSGENWGGRFLAVVGPSGSGKSSIVRAGLIPALKRCEPLADNIQPLHGSAGWPFHIITPTAHPLEALAASLTRDTESVTATSILIDDLARDPRSLHLFVQKQLSALASTIPLSRTKGQAGDGNYLLLVVDQFEELFTLCRDDTERRAFVDNLLYAADLTPPSLATDGEAVKINPEQSWSDVGPTIIIITLRTDFYSQCAPFGNLRQALSSQQEYIGPMNAEELRQAIEEPARRGRWSIEPGLVDLLIRDVGDEPGALPLLSHALLETWQQRKGRILTLTGYTASGGVRGAISRTAETTLRTLVPEQQAIARGIFLRLTELGEGTQDTRRRVALAELFPRPEQTPIVEAVLKTLVDARLVTTSDGTVEVAHEALIREWPALREWLDEDRQGLRLHRRITDAAQEWARLGHDPEALYGGMRLAQSWEWAETHMVDLNVLEREFLDTSKTHAEQEAADRESQRQRELGVAQKLAEAERHRAEEQARTAERLRGRSVILAIALILAGLLAVAALALGQQAQEKARLATSREWAAAALSNLDADPELSTWLAIHAVSKADTLEAENALHRAVQALRAQVALAGHTGDVWSVDFSPDGKRLATASADETAKVWDANTGQELLTLRGHAGWVNAIAFSPDGKILATASDDATAKLWDAQTGQELLTLTETNRIYSLAFSHDGRQLATANGDGVITLWSLNNSAVYIRAERVFTQTHLGAVSVTFCPDGKRLASGSDDGTVIMWDATTGHKLFTWLADTVSVWNLAFSPDGTRLVVGGASLITLWDVSSDTKPGQATLTLAGHRRGVSGVSFTPDGVHLVTGSQDGTAKVWDASTGQEEFKLTGYGPINYIAVSPDGNRAATGNRNGTATIWDISPTGSREVLTFSFDQSARVTAGNVSPDRTRQATISEEGNVVIRDNATGQELFTVTLPITGWISPIALSPDNTLLAVAQGTTAMVWQLATGQKLASMSGHQDSIVGLDFSPEGKYLATSGRDNIAKVWEIATGHGLLTLSGHMGPLNAITFSPDGKRLATASEDTTTRVWDAATGQELLRLTGDVYVAYSPDGTQLASASYDGMVRIWDSVTGQLLHTLSGHMSTVNYVSFSPDGRRLATASGDGTSKVWDTMTGQELLTLTGHTGAVLGAAFSPDGTRLTTSSTDRTFRIYTLQIKELVAIALSRLTSSLTPLECQKYLHSPQCPPVQWVSDP
jgi:WD40 repeat protein/DNA-binding SARP family transcriptional activator